MARMQGSAESTNAFVDDIDTRLRTRRPKKSSRNRMSALDTDATPY